MEFCISAASNRLPTVTVPLDELAQAIGGFRPETLLPYLNGRKGSDAELKAIADNRKSNGNDAELVGLVLASPAFQRC